MAAGAAYNATARCDGITDARRIEQAALKAGCGSVENTCYRHYNNTAACVMPPEGVRRTAAVGGPNSPVQS